MSDIAYQIGAVFLLVALILFGTVNGFVPKMFRVGKTGSIVVIVLITVIAACRYGPEAWSYFAASVFSPAPSTLAMPSEASQPTASRAAKPAAEARPAPHWKRVTADPETPPPGAQIIFAEPPEPAAQPAPILRVQAPAAAPAAASTVAPRVAPAASPSQGSASSPYDSGVKRAAKSVGHFLHIGRKKAASDSDQ